MWRRHASDPSDAFLDLGRGRHRLRAVRFLLPALLSAAALLGALPAAHAEEEVLHGPHPFIKTDELALHAGYSGGLGDNVSGLRLQGDYSYRLGQVIWFDVQMGVVSGSCRNEEIACSDGTGNSVDIVAGAAWKFQTRLPLIVHLRVAGGPLFLFPDSAQSSMGFLFRGGAGAHYYLYDWFGLGGEIAGAWGMGFFRADPSHTGQLGSVEATLGVALQF
jgi:hypothetical protein